MSTFFSPLEKAAWAGLLYIHAEINRVVENHLRDRFGISHPEFEILLRLNWRKERRMRIQDLAAESILTCSGMSRAVERLVKAGFLSREPASEDRRGAYASLRPEGERLLKAAMDEHVNLVRRHFLSALTADQMTAMAENWNQVEQHQKSLDGHVAKPSCSQEMRD